jgi:hypothetical protein
MKQLIPITLIFSGICCSICFLTNGLLSSGNGRSRNQKTLTQPLMNDLPEVAWHEEEQVQQEQEPKHDLKHSTPSDFLG